MRRDTIRAIRRVVLGAPEFWVGLCVWLVLGLLVGLSVQNILARLAP